MGRRHDQKVECFHWGAMLDHLAGMPPWPTDGEANREVIAFYERVIAHVEGVIGSLQERRGGTAQ